MQIEYVHRLICNHAHPVGYIEASQQMQTTVKIPKSGASRLSEDVWLLGEALSRYHKTNNLRIAIESAVRNYSDRLMKRRSFVCRGA